MRELVERLEAAVEPDAELGREVLLACGWRKTLTGHFYGPMYYWGGPNGEHFDDDDFRRHDPTRSIDAALTLPGAEACLEDALADVRFHGWVPEQFISALALALCISALRARESNDIR